MADVVELIARRRSMNWTTQDLAQLSGIDRKTLEWFEQGLIDGDYLRGRIVDALDLGRRAAVPEREGLFEEMRCISEGNGSSGDGMEMVEDLSSMVGSVLIWAPFVMLASVVVGFGFEYAVLVLPILLLSFLLGLGMCWWSRRRRRMLVVDRRPSCEIVLAGIRSGAVPVLGRTVAEGIELTMGRNSLADARAASGTEVRLVDDPTAEKFWSRFGRRYIRDGEPSSREEEHA